MFTISARWRNAQFFGNFLCRLTNANVHKKFTICSQFANSGRCAQHRPDDAYICKKMNRLCLCAEPIFEVAIGFVGAHFEAPLAVVLVPRGASEDKGDEFVFVHIPEVYGFAVVDYPYILRVGEFRCEEVAEIFVAVSAEVFARGERAVVGLDRGIEFGYISSPATGCPTRSRRCWA